MSIMVQTFRGLMPRIQPRALPNEAAQIATDTRLLSQGLDAWKDISSVHVLGKAGPTNTIYPFYDANNNLYWFSWATGELASGSTQVNVARVPIINDNTIRTIFTGTTLGPQITNKALAINPDVGPYGPYPDGSSQLAVPAPLVAPSVVNTAGTTGNVATPFTFTPSQILSQWTFSYVGPFGTATVVASGAPATVGGNQSALIAPVYQMQFSADNDAHSISPTSFSFSTCSTFNITVPVSSDATGTGETGDVYVQFLSSGGVGGTVRLGFNSGNNVQWTDQAGGGTTITLAASGITPSHGYSVTMVATNLGIVGTSRMFNALVTVTNINTGAVVYTTPPGSPLSLTYGGESVTVGGDGGSSPNTTNVFCGSISGNVYQPPTTFVPVYSNYVYTYDTSLLLESAPSPASAIVQVDNNNINTVTVPPVNASLNPDVAEVFLYRAATGSSGTQYLEVDNGTYIDGSFPICTVGGTGDAITLSDIQDTGAPLSNTWYWFKATNNGSGTVTVALNGTTARNISGSSTITAGNDYSIVYEQTIQYPVAQAALISQPVVILSSVTGLVVGQSVTDEAGAVPPNTVISVITTATNTITLSQNLTSALVTGDLFSFPCTIAGSANYQTYTLYSGFTYVDVTPTADLGEAITSSNYDPPPTTMINIIALPNEIMAGSSGNTLLLSAQGQPQAYPLEYQLGTDSNIVALVALDANIAILTGAHPYTAYGATPDAFTMTKETFIQGCVSARSASYLRGYGAVYASTDGIYAYGGLGQIRNLTEGFFTLQEWLPLNPSSILGVVHQGLYFFWYDTTFSITGSIAGTTLTVTAAPNLMLQVGTIITGSGVTANTTITEFISGEGGVGEYTVSQSQTVASETLTAETKAGYVLDPNPGGFGLFELSFHAIAATIDSTDDTLYLVIDAGTIGGSASYANNTLLEWEGYASYRPYTWHSKLYELPYATAFNLCRVRAESYAGLTLKLFADETLFATLNPTSDLEFVIPPQLGRTFEFEIEGSTPIETIQFVENPQELA